MNINAVTFCRVQKRNETQPVHMKHLFVLYMYQLPGLYEILKIMGIVLKSTFPFMAVLMLNIYRK